MLNQNGRRYEELQRRREAIREEINLIYQRYDTYIGSRLRCEHSFDELPTEAEFAAYDLPNTPLASLESALFKITVEMQDMRLEKAA